MPPHSWGGGPKGRRGEAAGSCHLWRRRREHAASPSCGRSGRGSGPADDAAARAVHRQRSHDRGRRFLWRDQPVGHGRPLARMGLMGVKGWEVVFRGERLKADLIAAVLESNGIRVEVFGDHAYSAAMNFTEARIMVPDVQAERARELISAAESTQV